MTQLAHFLEDGKPPGSELFGLLNDSYLVLPEQTNLFCETSFPSGAKILAQTKHPPSSARNGTFLD